MKNLGEIIRNRRVEMDMTQDQLASKLAYESRNTIAKIESGIIVPPLKKLYFIAKVLGLSIESFIGDIQYVNKKHQDQNVGIDVCPKCKEKIEESDNFCSFCGLRLKN
jgi:transcriptional regulator with XRE-family HTH domain